MDVDTKASESPSKALEMSLGESADDNRHHDSNVNEEEEYGAGNGEEDELLDEMQVAFDEIVTNMGGNYFSPDAIAARLQDLIRSERTDDRAVKIKEQGLYKLAKMHTEAGNFDHVLALIQSNSMFFNNIPKAKTAKIVRTILDIVAQVPDSLDIQVKLSTRVIEWCKAEKRTFLRQRIEARLSLLLLHKHESLTALQMINSLLVELKKLDDKQMLADAHLTEARIHHALKNIPKAKAALTSSRTSSQAIYVTPQLQAELDEMAGVLQVEEADYTTAYSYFLEAYDNYEATKNSRAVACLQYMILSKVLNGEIKNINKTSSGSGTKLGDINIVSDLTALLSSSKVALRYASARDISSSSSSTAAAGGGATSGQLRDLEAMIHISKAAGMKSLETFKYVVTVYSDVFQKDVLIRHNLERLYDKMLEQNLLKIISPYSCVEISYVAERIRLQYDVVERKLSQMILDHRFSGILDQGKGHLIIYPPKKDVANMTKGLEIIENMTQAVQTLAARAKKLNNSVTV